jgi:murein DD-endopeptidase MepM/ murein hydrolase activator NlpD
VPQNKTGAGFPPWGWMIASVIGVLVSCGGGSESPAPPSGPTCLNRAVFGSAAQSAYVLPYPVGTAYPVLQSYCEAWSHHDQLAYDFEMEVGTPISAARAGLVMRVVDVYPDSDQDPNHFNYIYIRHDDGTVAFYAHVQLQSLLIAENGRVETGQLMARSGSCGTPIADLHFGVYRSWPPREGEDLAVNFRNAEGPLDSRGGLRRGISYLALPY